ncbi:MAG: YdcF family protein [Beijerinckiaceae bacterium]
MDMTLHQVRPNPDKHDPDPRKSGQVVMRFTAFAFCAASVVAITGFFAFVGSLERKEPVVLAQGDGIVALTGGAERISDAIERLAEGRGKRLLISGINTNVSIPQILHSAPGLKNWLRCCIDLDHQARNTVENAEETRRWAKAHGYKSLVVVTSSYHMPRTMVEFQRHMPDVLLIPAPVVTPRLEGLDYWRDPQLMKTLGQEYAKFVVAFARARLTSPASSVDITGSISRRRV